MFCYSFFQLQVIFNFKCDIYLICFCFNTSTTDTAIHCCIYSNGFTLFQPYHTAHVGGRGQFLFYSLSMPCGGFLCYLPLWVDLVFIIKKYVCQVTKKTYSCLFDFDSQLLCKNAGNRFSCPV